nr:hypothetical protein BaRGS_004986 [Batillaria attramentaria]
MVEEKREELLMQLTRLMSGVEDQLNQVLVEVEGRKSQIDQARAKVREARGSANAMLVMRTVQELQQNVRHLPPLRDVPAGLKSASGVQFHQGHSLLSSMQSDSLGDVTTLGQLSPLDATCFPKGRTPPSLQLQANLNAGFVSGIATYGAYGNAIFVTGCDKVYRLSTTDVGGPHAHLFAVDSRFWKKPWGVAVTTDNKVLVTDAGAGPSEGCVAVFGVDGKFMSYVATGLSMPRGIAASIMGQVFVCDQEDRCVYVFDAHKNFSLVKLVHTACKGQSEDELLERPAG